MDDSRFWSSVSARDAPPQSDQPNTGNQLLRLAENPFQSRFVANALWTALGVSVGFTVALALLFSLLRPHISSVYAPKLKGTDSRHAPPPLGRGLFAWVTPLMKKREADLVGQIGLDAIVFLRFTRMCRNLFLVMSVIGCGVLIPTNVLGSLSTQKGLSALTLMTPLNAPPKSLWAQVVCSWLFDAMVAFALWWNYRAVTRLRIAYFESAAYQARLHSRTLMVTKIPSSLQTDEGLYLIASEANSTSSTPRCAIGRNVRGLSELIKEHEKAVRELESVLAKYLKNPYKLPPNRPTCRVKDEHHGYTKGDTVDAIEYMTERIRSLEYQIKDSREKIDNRESMPYGFVSYNSMPEAHAIAYMARTRHAHGTTIKLAPTPEDLIWDNLRLTKGARRMKRFVNVLWVALLTVIWIVPNALIAIFLSDLSNLGLLWPAFQKSLEAHSFWWAAVQGIAAPGITTLCYFLLPILFRRLGIRAGDMTKTSRERHVIHNLYAFFVFNNLVVFTAFSAIAQFISVVVNGRAADESVWTAIVDGQLGNKLATALCNVSPFWVTYLLQRNLGAAVDISQLWNLFAIWFQKTFMNPTPRERYEWTRPPPFDYASYYNYFLFYATVSLCFATLQPLVLPVTALYFCIDSVLKKYLLMYIFVTKNESGGQFWRVLFNRLVFATIFANIAITLVAYTREYATYPMVFSMVPLPFLMLGFKLYCKKVFDDKIHFYRRMPIGNEERFGDGDKRSRRNDKLVVKFGNPALYKQLITPIVLDEAKDVLMMIYRGRLGDDISSSGYGEIHMDPMSDTVPGKPMREPAMPFEFVSENHLDFADPNNRHDFNDDYGQGTFVGNPQDLVSERSDTPRSFGQGSYPSRPASLSSSTVGYSRVPPMPPTYPRPGHRASSSLSRTVASSNYGDASDAGLYAHPNESESQLLHGAEGMPLAYPASRQVSANSWSPTGDGYRGSYGQVPQHPADEPTFSYEEYRRGHR